MRTGSLGARRAGRVGAATATAQDTTPAAGAASGRPALPAAGTMELGGGGGGAGAGSGAAAAAAPSAAAPAAPSTSGSSSASRRRGAGDEGGDGAAPPARRLKHENQKKVLETWFILNPRPDGAAALAIAREANLSVAEVKRWFRNRRHFIKIAQEDRRSREELGMPSPGASWDGRLRMGKLLGDEGVSPGSADGAPGGSTQPSPNDTAPHRGGGGARPMRVDTVQAIWAEMHSRLSHVGSTAAAADSDCVRRCIRRLGEAGHDVHALDMNAVLGFVALFESHVEYLQALAALFDLPSYAPGPAAAQPPHQQLPQPHQQAAAQPSHGADPGGAGAWRALAASAGAAPPGAGATLDGWRSDAHQPAPLVRPRPQPAAPAAPAGPMAPLQPPRPMPGYGPGPGAVPTAAAAAPPPPPPPPQPPPQPQPVPVAAPVLPSQPMAYPVPAVGMPPDGAAYMAPPPPPHWGSFIPVPANFVLRSHGYAGDVHMNGYDGRGTLPQ